MSDRSNEYSDDYNSEESSEFEYIAPDIYKMRKKMILSLQELKNMSKKELSRTMHLLKNVIKKKNPSKKPLTLTCDASALKVFSPYMRNNLRRLTLQNEDPYFGDTKKKPKTQKLQLSSWKRVTTLICYGDPKLHLFSSVRQLIQLRYLSTKISITQLSKRSDLFKNLNSLEHLTLRITLHQRGENLTTSKEAEKISLTFFKSLFERKKLKSLLLEIPREAFQSNRLDVSSLLAVLDQHNIPEFNITVFLGKVQLDQFQLDTDSLVGQIFLAKVDELRINFDSNIRFSFWSPSPFIPSCWGNQRIFTIRECPQFFQMNSLVDKCTSLKSFLLQDGSNCRLDTAQFSNTLQNLSLDTGAVSSYRFLNPHSFLLSGLPNVNSLKSLNYALQFDELVLEKFTQLHNLPCMTQLQSYSLTIGISTSVDKSQESLFIQKISEQISSLRDLQNLELTINLKWAISAPFVRDLFLGLENVASFKISFQVLNGDLVLDYPWENLKKLTKLEVNAFPTITNQNCENFLRSLQKLSTLEVFESKNLIPGSFETERWAQLFSQINSLKELKLPMKADIVKEFEKLKRRSLKEQA